MKFDNSLKNWKKQHSVADPPFPGTLVVHQLLSCSCSSKPETIHTLNWIKNSISTSKPKFSNTALSGYAVNQCALCFQNQIAHFFF